MRKNYILSLFLLAGIASTALANLEIVWPYGFKQWWEEHPESTHTSIASFGEIPWGRKIIGRMGLAEPPNACSYIQLDDAADHVPAILVALRGDCPFSLKAHYAQLAGAKLLVIVDNQYEDVDSRLMVDNSGHSETIHIASVLLARQAGDRLIESLNHTDAQIHEIVGRFDFTIPKGDKVSYNLWLSSSSQQTFRFLKDWKQYYDTSKSDAEMTPHFGHFESYDPVSRTINSDNCVCGTRYCATDPDGDLSNTGRDVLFENLRQMCLIDNYGVDTWWKYVLEYNEACLSGGDMAECSRATLIKLKVQPDDIEWCRAKSFDNVDPTQCTKNKRFDAEKDLLTKEGIILFPSVTINGFGYRGNLVPAKGVFEAVCESFTTMPEVCNQHFEQVGVPTPVEVTKSRGPVVLTAIIFLAIFSVFVFCCYRRYLARTMYKQGIREVNMAVSQYISLKDDEAVRKDSY